MTRKIERRLDVASGWSGATAGIDLNADPLAALQLSGALLLRKARIHTLAVLRANETSNLHSLAVQMRPVLECAGQVVFFYTTIIAPDLLMSRENAAATFGNRLNADFYQTLRRTTRGQISPEKLREIATEAQAAAAASFGAAMPKKQKSWSFRQADKMTTVAKGHEWYNYLSDHFTHGKLADWKGLSWRGGVISIDKVEDEFAFLGLMSYLVDQVALMNAAAALCPVAGDADDQWNRWIEPTLAQLRDVRESSKTLVDAARVAVTGELDGSAGTG
ncbi:MAG: hypothetical protein OXM87_14025 [Truepera sp.]|nr:hypothetical protein [Truepera sp.]